MSEKVVRMYNGDEVISIFGPYILQSGRGPETFIKIEYDAETVMDAAGADGEVTISRIKDGRASITYTFMKSSECNLWLSVQNNLAKNAPNMAGAVLPLLIQDINSGGTIYSAANAWVQKPPSAEFGKNPDATLDWVVRAANLIYNESGNIAL